MGFFLFDCQIFSSKLSHFIMSWTWLIEVCSWEKILLEGPQCILHLSRSHGTVRAPWTYMKQPFPSIWFCFQPLSGHHKTSTLSTQRCYSPNSSFVGPFFSLLALFLVTLPLQALQISLRDVQFLPDVQVCSTFSENYAGHAFFEGWDSRF